MSKQIVFIEEKIKFSNYIQLSSSDSTLDESNLEKKSLDDPIEIYFIQKKELKISVITIKYKIKHLKISAMIIDSKAKPFIIIENIIECMKVKINKSKTYDLSDIATILIESVRVIHKLPIILASGCTIHEDFIVVKYHKSILIFSNQFLKKYNCIID